MKAESETNAAVVSTPANDEVAVTGLATSTNSMALSIAIAVGGGEADARTYSGVPLFAAGWLVDDLHDAIRKDLADQSLIFDV